ncbi:tetratricopeptide repeat protein [Paenibacillus pasadenensis]|uniref:tetratricopeptide repeat protein n=1 Tax=Paenibacillus pasadenensis TaxID=217090 RepID=UPI00203E1B56|nr:tetratricopeptide repeat protein [Paenibacillus pasadenensis]MCM3747496.1 tetratricopeptide repeat protein [Paenibacillus pasadenensis]
MDGESCIKKAYECILNGNFDEAITWFLQAIELEPENAAFHYKCSLSCARSGKWELALQHAAKACELKPEHEEYRYHWDVVEARRLVADAKLMMASGEGTPAEIMAFLQEARILDPLHGEACFLAAQCCIQLGRLHEAKLLAAEAYRLEPGLEEARRLYRQIKKMSRRRGHE